MVFRGEEKNLERNPQTLWILEEKGVSEFLRYMSSPRPAWSQQWKITLFINILIMDLRIFIYLGENFTADKGLTY